VATTPPTPLAAVTTTDNVPVVRVEVGLAATENVVEKLVATEVQVAVASRYGPEGVVEPT
jgi:hypothetical protein